MNIEQFRKNTFGICQLSLNSPLLIGVSGGPDSLCLLDLLNQLHFPLVVAHFDHRLRPESAMDAEVVRFAADRLGLPFVLDRQDVGAYAREMHLSVEEAARQLRYRFLFDQARRYSAQAVAVGHTADDQVETVLMHLLRGAGLNGLKGMSFRTLLSDWDASIPLVRPLLNVWREETLAHCRERGLEPVFDASNQDTAFFRNRVRQELVPLLQALNPLARQNIWRTAMVLAGDEAVIEAAVQTAWERCFIEQVSTGISLRLSAMAAIQEGLQRNVMRRALELLLPSLRDIDFSVIDRAVSFIHAPLAGQIDLAQGLILFVEGDRLWIAAPGSLPTDPAWPQLAQDGLSLPVLGVVALSSEWHLFSTQFERGDLLDVFPKADVQWEAWFDADTLPASLCVRRARPGDRFQPFGMTGRSVKLSDYWINQKLPRRARAAWPLVVCGDSILWVPGYRTAEPFKVTADTKRILHLRLVRIPSNSAS